MNNYVFYENASAAQRNTHVSQTQTQFGFHSININKSSNTTYQPSSLDLGPGLLIFPSLFIWPRHIFILFQRFWRFLPRLSTSTNFGPDPTHAFPTLSCFLLCLILKTQFRLPRNLMKEKALMLMVGSVEQIRTTFTKAFNFSGITDRLEKNKQFYYAQ